MLLTIILMTLLFAAVTAGVATVSLAIRDLRRRRPSTLDKRLGLDREVEDVHLLLAAKSRVRGSTIRRPRP